MEENQRGDETDEGQASFHERAPFFDGDDDDEQYQQQEAAA